MWPGVMVLESADVVLRDLVFVAGHWYVGKVRGVVMPRARESEVFVVESQLMFSSTVAASRVRSWKLTSPRAWPRKGASIDEGLHVQTPTTTIQRTFRTHCITSLSSSRSIS